MTLSPEQFKKLVTKQEHKELEKKVDYLAVKVDKILDVVEGIATAHKRFDQELIMNVSAHDRFERRITKLEGANI